MTGPRVVGLDLSLTSTGVADVTPDRAEAGAVKPPKGVAGMPRLRHLVGALVEVAGGADLVVVEGLAFGSRTGHAGERGGLWHMVWDAVDRAGVPWAVASPAVRAKYGAGKGSASKDEVLAAVVRRYLDVDVRGNDAADALVLAAMGMRHLGEPIESDLPKANLTAMASVHWPDLTRRVG